MPPLSIAGVEVTPQVVIATLLTLWLGNWLYKSLHFFLVEGERLGTREEAEKASTTRSRLLQDLDPPPDDLNLKEEEELVISGGAEKEIVAELKDEKEDELAEVDSEASVVDNDENEEASEPVSQSSQAQSNASPDEASEQQGDAEEEEEETPPPPAAEGDVAPSTPAETPVQFANKTNDHPGLEHFWHWCDVESSLYRLYNVARRDGEVLAPPYVPKSRAGRVQVLMMVTNRCLRRRIEVFWINYKGGETSKGVISPSGFSTFKQFTWIEHPWVFRDADTGELLLHYIPDRVLPVTAMDNNPASDLILRDTYNRLVDNPDNAGVHRFAIQDPLNVDDNPFVISIYDPVLPFPAEHHIKTVDEAVRWTVHHMLRVTVGGQGNMIDWDIILKYLYNILEHPDQPKYRRIRTANKVFNTHIWNTAARGLFLVAGFVEQGAYAELGTNKSHGRDEMLRMLSSFCMGLAQWKQRWGEFTSGDSATAQPAGASGFGRAGFGIAGSNAYFES